MATNLKGFNLNEQEVAIIDAICRQIISEGLSSALPVGGSTGQALAKNSGTDGDVSWQTIAGAGATNLAGISDMSVNARTLNTKTFAGMRSDLSLVVGTDVAAEGHSHSNVVASGAAGYMTGADKAKLDGIEVGATADLTGAEIVALINGTLGGTGWQSGSGGGNVATDVIWNAAGDLAVGTGSDTAARLAMGTALQVLRVNAGGTALEYATISGVTDGDKTDINVSSGGTVWTIDPGVVTLAKMANLAQDQFIGRVTASTGVPETATITAAARTVLDDTTVANMVNTLGGATSSGTGGLVRTNDASFGGRLTYAGNYTLTAAAMGALAIATTESLNTKDIAANSTFTFSAQPATANTFFGMHVRNTDSNPHILTFPSSRSLVTQGLRTTCPIPAGGELYLGWRWDGTEYKIFGDSDYFNKYDGTAAPGVGDDIADGYGPGSFWLDATNNNTYICESNAAGAAVWHQVNGTGGGGATNLDGLTDVVISSPATGHILRHNGTNFVNVDGATVYQPLDATLTALAGATIAANSLLIGSGADAFNVITFAANTFVARASTGNFVAKGISDFGLSLVDDNDAAAARVTLAIDEAVDDRVGALLVLPTGAYDDAGNSLRLPIVIPIAVSDETTALTTGTAKISFTMPVAMTLTAISASVVTAPTGANLIADVNGAGTTLMTTNKCVIEATELNTHTAATQPTITDTTLAKGEVVTVDIDQVGSTVAGAGLKVYLVGFITGF